MSIAGQDKAGQRYADAKRVVTSATAGHGPRATEIVQIGAVIVPPDFTGDINNYAIWCVPRLVLSGTVNPSPMPAGSFVANWWQAAMGGNVKMSTNVPVINIGGADLFLTTNQHDPLGQLIGGSSTGFPIIQQFNTFDAAHMQVSVVSR